MNFFKYLSIGTVAGALDRSEFSLEEVSAEADSVWKDGATSIATISIADECSFEFHFFDGAFSHDGVNIYPPNSDVVGTLLTLGEVERNEVGVKRFDIDDELILLLQSGVAVHYRKTPTGCALYKLDGKFLPYVDLERYLSSLC